MSAASSDVGRSEVTTANSQPATVQWHNMVPGAIFDRLALMPNPVAPATMAYRMSISPAMLSARIVSLCLGALVVALGCAEPTDSKPQAAPVLTLRASASTTDTIEAGPVLLTAQVHDPSGRPIGDARVSFSVARVAYVPFMYVAPATSPFWRGLVVGATTDASGTASAVLWHGLPTGTGWVRVDVRLRPPFTEIDVIDSIEVITLPGNPVELRILPGDTAVYEGSSATIIPRMVDRGFNPRSETGSLTVLTSGISNTGTTVTATAGPSRQMLRATYGTHVDTGYISIVPRGEIAVRLLRQENLERTFAFAHLQLDGSRFTPFVSREPPTYFGSGIASMGLHWEPDRESLAFHHGQPATRLFRTSRAGVVTPLLPTAVSAVNVAPQASADSQWIYFNVVHDAPRDESYVFRASSAGSVVEQISRPGPQGTTDLNPSPSPDGRYVVYATNRAPSISFYALRLEIIELATGAVTSLSVDGRVPRWSPDGQWIVFGRNEELWVIRPDGTGPRRISAAGHRYEPQASWSPDSRWLVAENVGRYLELIEVASGLTLRLGYSELFAGPTWRP